MPGIEQYREKNPHNLTEEQLAKIETELKDPSRKTISDACLEYKLWCQGLKTRQELFADYVEASITGLGIEHILEVGGGKLGRASLLLAERGYYMTCMDPKLEIKSQPALQAVKAKFDYRTAVLSGYDLVIGEEPCEAAEHIIRAGLAQNVPFIVALCGTPHTLISGEMPENVWEWYRYLKQIDYEHTLMEPVKLYGDIGVMIIRSTRLA